MRFYLFSAILGVAFLTSCVSKKVPASSTAKSPFRIENLIPWSIVAFDSEERTPSERIAMIKRLGFRQYAFGGRAKHIARMEEELNLAKAENIEISAVWLYINHKKDRVGQLKPMSEQVFQSLKNTGLKTQIWAGFHHDYFKNLSDENAFQKGKKMIEYLAQRADSIGCKIALYNHGGWFGEPENQLKIIESLPQYDLGIIYNFHHGHGHLTRYEELFEMMLPHLWCVNLNGMKKSGKPKILTIGEGDYEQTMIKKLINLNYQGSYGILGHVKGGDAEEILKKNLKGLRNCM